MNEKVRGRRRGEDEEDTAVAENRQSRSARASKMPITDTEQWDYNKVKEVVTALYTIVSLFMTQEQKQKLDKVHTDVAGIFGVKSLADWTPPQHLLDMVGLQAGHQAGRRAA